MKRKCIFILPLLTSLISSCDKGLPEWRYPQINSEPVTDIYFGKQVVDDYRLLERGDTPVVQEWYSEQKKFYADVMNHLSGRDSIANELKRYISTSSIRAYVPRVGGRKLFIKKVDDEKNSQILVSTDSDGTNQKEIVNTSNWNGNGNNYSIDYFEPSHNGKFVVVGVSKNGDEISTLYIFDVEENKKLNDSIPNCYLANPSWLHDDSGFFYNHLKDIKSDEDEQTKYEDSRVKVHLIGNNAREDKTVFSKAVNKTLSLQQIDFPFFYTYPKSDRSVAFVYRGSSPYVSIFSCNESELLSNPLKTRWIPITNENQKATSVVILRNEAYLLTFERNSSGSLDAVNLNNPTSRRLIYDAKDVILKEMFQTEKNIFIKYLKNGIYGLLKYDPVDNSTVDVKLPVEGAVTLAPEYKLSTIGSDLYLGLESWTRELGIYKYDGNSFSLTDIRPQSKFGRPDFLIAKEVLVRSHDGTEVPLTIIHHKDIKLNGNNPTILYGYGAYGTNIEPGFDVTQLPWYNRGGIYAMAHVRGGGEKGDDWYSGGYKSTKSNSWKDFTACAEYLITNNYTSSNKLAAYGGSAGAITVGRSITDNPNLFKAAVIQVGALNSIRAETSMNTLSVAEFGTVTDSLEFNYLMDMDVYHHIKKNVVYPSILFSCALNDARVAAWEPSKVVAKMQRYGTGKNIVLMRVSDEGHLGDNDFIKETSDIYSFVLWQLGDPNFKYTVD